MVKSLDQVLVYCLKVPIRQAETVKQSLIKSGIFLKNFKLLKEEGFIFFPIGYTHDQQFDFPVEQKLFTPLKQKFDFHSSLRNILPLELHKFIPTSFDRIGSLILIKLHPSLRNFYYIIGSELVNQFTVTSVFNKVGDVETEYRTITWNCIAGPDNPITIHKMHGLRFKVNIQTVYFNVRLSNEYLRVANTCHDNDTIIDMFAGIGPFSILCASFHKVSIYAFDINQSAIDLLNDNILLNKDLLDGTIYVSCGDSRELIKPLPKANKIIMNLPGFAIEFLDKALEHLAQNGVIYLHQFIHLSKDEKKKDLNEPKEKIRLLLSDLDPEAGKNGYMYEITGNKLRDVSPSKVHFVWDITKQKLSY